MKQITIAGNIGKDAETRTTQGGDKVTGFTVAVKDRDAAVWFDVNLWGNRGEKLAQYLTKGSSVTVSGDLGTREHNGKTYLTVKADQITLQGGKRQDEPQRSRTAEAAHRSQAPADDLNDDLPF